MYITITACVFSFSRCGSVIFVPFRLVCLRFFSLLIKLPISFARSFSSHSTHMPAVHWCGARRSSTSRRRSARTTCSTMRMSSRSSRSFECEQGAVYSPMRKCGRKEKKLVLVVVLLFGGVQCKALGLCTNSVI